MRVNMNTPKKDVIYDVTVDGVNWFEAVWTVFYDGDDVCTTWQATTDNHPSCWTDGVCWGLNEDNMPSAPVIQYKESNNE